MLGKEYIKSCVNNKDININLNTVYSLIARNLYNDVHVSIWYTCPGDVKHRDTFIVYMYVYKTVQVANHMCSCPIDKMFVMKWYMLIKKWKKPCSWEIFCIIYDYQK